MIKQCSIALLLAFTVGAFAAPKTPIYRCGQTYSQTPCRDGHIIESSDPRTAAQRAEAQRITEREKQLGAQMERDRRAAEADSAPAVATGFDARATHASASAPSKTKKKGTKAANAASGPGVVFITPRPAQK